MKLHFVFSAALFAALLPRLFGAPIAAESRIIAVAVYLDRAVVSRTATVELATAEPVELVFEKLPATLLDQSLQVAGQGTAPATLLDVTARPTFVDFTPNERVKTLEDELRALNHEDRTLADRLTLLGQQREYVLKIQNATTTPSKESPAAPVSTENWINLLKFSADQLSKIADDVQSTETRREDLQAKRTALEQQLNQLRSDGGRSYKTVTVRLATTSPGRLEVTLRYTVPGASWTPTYDARAATSEPAVTLGYFGLVRQNTGEDWNGIDLTLSTARPALGGAAPELQPWIVQQREILPVSASPQDEEVTLSPFTIDAKKDKGYRTANTLAGTRVRTELHEVSSSITVVKSQATSATFHIAEKTDIPSDNAPHKVGIATVPLKAELAYQTTPKLLPSAFLTASVANTSDYPLLAGAANVFLDDTFVATASLRAVMPGEKFDLALGADDAIAVKRKLNNRFAEDTGLVNKGRRLTYDYTLSVQNNKKAAAKITVVDQVPVSRHEKIVVRVLTPDEKTAKPDADGTLKWNLSLAPGEKRELPLKFSIEYPNDLPVTGLE